jgi:hypothetical protein
VVHFSSLGILPLAQAHFTEGMVEEVSLSDPRPATMITWTTTLGTLVTIVMRTDLLSMNATISVVGQSWAARVTTWFLR